MRFVYQYKTGRNETREGVIRASSRDAVYAELKKLGVRASRVTPAPGLWNHVLFVLGRRGIAIVILGVALASLTAYVLVSSIDEADPSAAATHRHQIYGDPAILEKMYATEFASVFEDEGLRFLAQYAIPGRVVQPCRKATTADALRKCLSSHIKVASDDPREVRELKQIVRGMVEELHTYLSVGSGTEWSYVGRLEAHQTRELQIVELVRKELEGNADPAFWEARNNALRELGLRTFSRKREGLLPRTP